jgi:hypothetical protein
VDLQGLEARVEALLASLRAALPGLHLGMVPELIAVREWQVALEMIFDHLFDQNEGRCPGGVYEELLALAQILNVERRYWEDLRAE